MQVMQAIGQNKVKKKGKLPIYRLGVEHSLFRLGLSTLIFVLIRVKLSFSGQGLSTHFRAGVNCCLGLDA